MFFMRGILRNGSVRLIRTLFNRREETDDQEIDIDIDFAVHN